VQALAIGAATALAFAKEGAHVVVADINETAAEATAGEIKKLKGKAIFIKTNIAQHSEVKKMVSLAVKRFGKLDCAVNCAGIAGKHTLAVHEYPEDDWINMININLIGTYYCVKEEIKQMLENSGGSIVNVSSAAGLIAQPFNSPYAASKLG
jgi:NAD(P)-dependent dehydrogenase (short-subunit alcohol dehydrogenase family)